MLHRWRNYFFIFLLLWFAAQSVNAAITTTESIPVQQHAAKSKMIADQIVLLNARVDQAQNALNDLQQAQTDFLNNLRVEQVSQTMVKQLEWDISVAKSNLGGLDVEVGESQQTINHLQKDIQETENQINALSIFNLKAINTTQPDLNRLQHDLAYQKETLTLEKERNALLQKLHNIASDTVQSYTAKYNYVNSLLKSQTVLHLREAQSKGEEVILLQQADWLKLLNHLNSERNVLLQSKNYSKLTLDKLDDQIFYLNESLNFSYLQRLVVRYENKFQQLKISTAHSQSITLLNNALDQIQLLSKQTAKVRSLVKIRQDNFDQRKDFLINNKSENQIGLADIDKHYLKLSAKLTAFTNELLEFRQVLDQSLQRELSSRQGLPGLDSQLWLDLGAELLLLPTLAYEAIKSLIITTGKNIVELPWLSGFVLILLEFLWIIAFRFLNNLLIRVLTSIPDHEYGHINLKWLVVKIMHYNLVPIALVANFAWFFPLCGVPQQNYSFLIQLGLVLIVFSSVIKAIRICLLESVHDRTGDDVRLFYRLKWVLVFGGVVSIFTVFVHQLPVVYEIKDLFDRLFLVFLLLASLFLLSQWRSIPNLFVPHIENSNVYLKRIINFLGILIPTILLANSVIGLFGFVNLVLTISWYESIFILVLIGYLLFRGFLKDLMEFFSKLLIRHVTNGWLWTEAFLKPLDRVLHILLFLLAGFVLFALYGWDKQSIVISSFSAILNYHLIEMPNTAITLLTLLELVIMIAVLIWAARWTREFVYRFLLSRTKDLGLRNSIAILSQYSMIVIGIFVCLQILHIDFSTLKVVAGAFAFGVGLGLRDLVNNFACGFLLLIERPVRVGDIVSINDCEGEVTHIGGRSITLKTWDHLEVIIPNSDVFNKTLTNWTAKDNIVRTVINIKVNRQDNPESVQAIIHKTLEKNKEILMEPIPEVFLKELTDGMVELEIRYFINLKYVKSRLGVRSEVLSAIWKAFEENNIEAPYPHHEILVKK